MSGIDFSYWRPPSAQWVRDQGYQFVCRYLSSDPAKRISPVEFATYRAAGLAVVLVWEDGAKDMLYGFAAKHAMESQRQAEQLGVWPCTIYFTADFDVTPTQQLSVNAYLDTVAAYHGRKQGIYGGFYAVQRAMDAGHATYGWQTFAWSGSQWYSRAQIRQIPGGSGQYDLDESVTADFGQIGGHMFDDNDRATLIKQWVGTAAAGLGILLTDTEVDTYRLLVHNNLDNQQSVLAKIAVEHPRPTPHIGAFDATITPK